MAAGGIWSVWLQLTRAPWKTINGILLESSQGSLSALQFPLNYPDHVILCNFQNLIVFKAFSQYLFITLLITVFGFQPNSIYRWVVNSGNSLGLGIGTAPSISLSFTPISPSPTFWPYPWLLCGLGGGVQPVSYGQGGFNTHLLVHPSYNRDPLKVQGSLGHQSHEAPARTSELSVLATCQSHLGIWEKYWFPASPRSSDSESQ